MDIGGIYVVSGEVFAHLFGHSLGDGGDEDALVAFDALLDFFHQIVYLIGGGADFNDGIEEACGTYELFDDEASALLEFVFFGGSRDVYGLRGEALKFFEGEGAVVACGWESESVVDEVSLARLVASVHGSYLWDGLVALVYDEEKVFREKVEETVWALAFLTAVEVA